VGSISSDASKEMGTPTNKRNSTFLLGVGGAHVLLLGLLEEFVAGAEGLGLLELLFAAGEELGHLILSEWKER
jgi:hypothetical protein